MSLRDQLMKAGLNRPISTVDCSDLGAGKVSLRVLSGAEADKYMQELIKQDYRSGARSKATLIALSVVSESGENIFTLEDVPEIEGWQRPLLDRLYVAAFSHNKLGVADQAALEGN